MDSGLVEDTPRIYDEITQLFRSTKHIHLLECTHGSIFVFIFAPVVDCSSIPLLRRISHCHMRAWSSQRHLRIVAVDLFFYFFLKLSLKKNLRS